MNCSDVQRVLPEVGESGQNDEFQAHLKSCSACAELVSELALISSRARQLVDSDEPSPRVWLRIAAELRSEGLIRDPGTRPARKVLVPEPRRRWNAWWLVPVAASLVAAGAYVLNPKPAAIVTEKTSVTAAAPQSVPPAVTSQEGAEDQQFLDEVSQRAPMMKATYESELRSVNSYIRDARSYADQNPGDEDAHQHLMDAYEEKEMLYQMALDHIQ